MKAKVIDMQQWKKSKMKPVEASTEILDIPDIVQIFKALGIFLIPEQTFTKQGPLEPGQPMPEDCPKPPGR